MVFLFRSLFPVFFLFIFPAVEAQDLKTTGLTGTWQFRQRGNDHWMAAQVPGTVHLDLLRNGGIPDPFFGDNEKLVQWVGEADWEYRNVFQIGEEDLNYKHIELVCEGLDTYAQIFLNGYLVMKTDNMFREWVADVHRYLKAGDNTLEIFFPSAVKENSLRYGLLPKPLPGDEKVVCRKAGYHFGWDWGPVLITCGIWRPVFVRRWNDIRVGDVCFLQKTLNEKEAGMEARFHLLSDIHDSVEIRIFLDSVEVRKERFPIRKGTVDLHTRFSIPSPQLWWPNGLGSPHLYEITYAITSGENKTGSGRQKIGLRTCELIQEPDSAGRSFYFRINGQPVFMKGANYIPQDNFLPRATDSAYRSLIGDVRKTHINMLRVWGGGIYEGDIFYDLCDENGILVWQDFMFACALYPGDSAFLNNVRAEAKDNVIRLRRHPSLALWCGNNEIDEGWKNWGWQKQYGYSHTDSIRIYEDYQRVFDTILPGMVRQYDVTRPYISTSPLHGWGQKASMQEGDSHYWGVWWGNEPFSMYENKTGRFMSEYGFQGFPDLATIRSFTLSQDRALQSPAMKAHQKHPTGYETIGTYMDRDYRKPDNFEMYGYASQLLQAKGMRVAIEAHRKSKPRCMGTLFWQLNDCWPVVSWSCRDYYGRKKAFFYELLRLYDTILIIPALEQEKINVYISSDIPRQKRANLHIRLVQFTGKTIIDDTIPVVIVPNSARIYYSIPMANLLNHVDPATVVFAASFIGPGEAENKRLLYFTAPKELKLPIPVISKKITETANGYEILISSEHLIKSAYLKTSLDGDFSDNYFDVLPGEVYKVTFNSPVKNMKMDDLIVLTTLGSMPEVSLPGKDDLKK